MREGKIQRNYQDALYLVPQSGGHNSQSIGITYYLDAGYKSNKLASPTSEEYSRLFFKRNKMTPEERLIRLKRWLRRTHLSHWDFCIQLNKKRRKEVGQMTDIRLRTCPKLHRNILKELGFPFIFSDYSCTLELPSGHNVSVYLENDNLRYLYANGIQFWCGRISKKQLSGMLETISVLMPLWKMEDEYVKTYFDKLAKIEALKKAAQEARALCTRDEEQCR